MYLKYIYYLFINLIKYNIIKTIIILLSLVSLTMAMIFGKTSTDFRVLVVDIETNIQVVLYCLSVLLLIVVLIGSFDRYFGWDLYDCIKNSFKKMISHKVENNKHIYRIGNRLLSDGESRSPAPIIFYPTSYRELKKYPIYYTKEEIRNKKLKNLGI